MKTTFTFHMQVSQYIKSVYYSGITVFNNLPTNMKYLSHGKKQFRTALKNFSFD